MRLPFTLLIIRHWREAKRLTNSGRLVPLCIDNAIIVDLHGSYKEVKNLIPRNNTWLLFPESVDASGVVCIPSRKGLPDILPDTVVVIDGTWSEAHSMARELKNVPRLIPSRETCVNKRLLTPPSSNGMATAEAVAAMIEEINPVASACLNCIFTDFVSKHE